MSARFLQSNSCFFVVQGADSAKTGLQARTRARVHTRTHARAHAHTHTHQVPFGVERRFSRSKLACAGSSVLGIINSYMPVRRAPIALLFNPLWSAPIRPPSEPEHWAVVVSVQPSVAPWAWTPANALLQTPLRMNAPTPDAVRGGTVEITCSCARP